MPRFNARGEWCAGVGGDRVTVNGTVIAANAGGACWLDDTRVIYQQGAHLETFDLRNGEIVTVDPQGSFALYAGGGVYAAAFTDGVRVSSDTAKRWLGYGIADVGPDGIALLKTPDGLFDGRLLSDVQALGGGAWSALDASGRPVAAGVAPVVAVPGRIYGLRRRGDWCIYQAEQGARLIVSRVDRLVGRVLAIEPNAFRPDLIVLGDHVEVIYAVQEGEAPDAIRRLSVPLSALTESLESAPPVPVPVPVPVPPVPVEAPVSVPNYMDLVQAVWDANPSRRQALSEASAAYEAFKRGRTDDQVEREGDGARYAILGQALSNAKGWFANAAAYQIATTRDARVGNRQKEGTYYERTDGKHISTDGLMFRDSGQMVDVLSDRGLSGWNVREGDTQPTDQWIAAIPPDGSAPVSQPIPAPAPVPQPPPVVVPPPPPVVVPPAPVVDLSEVLSKLDAMQRQQLENSAQLTAIAAQLAALKAPTYTGHVKLLGQSVSFTMEPKP